MTHWRFSCENPRSVWIDGSATFTTAMSRTTMNWTVQSRARANHLRRVADIRRTLFRLGSTRWRNYSLDFLCASTGFRTKSKVAMLRLDGPPVRPVLPRRERAVDRRGALGAPDRPRAAEGPAPLHRPDRRAARHRHEGPRHAPARARGRRRRPASQAAAARRLDRVRADRVRRRPRG